MKISDDIKLDFDDVLIKPKRSTIQSRADVELLRTFTCMHSKFIFQCVPIIAANLDTVGTFAMAKSLNQYHCMTSLHKFYTDEDIINNIKNNVNYSLSFVTLGNNAIQRLQDFKEYGDFCPKFICLDYANGYTETFNDLCKKTRELCPESFILAGNVCTPEMTEQLLLSGVSCVKLQIGPGRLCETRKVTGVGYPSLSCILECKDAAHGLGGLVCSDGGCKTTGDVCKALGAGADFVMLGGMFAGTEECDGEWTYDYELTTTQITLNDGSKGGMTFNNRLGKKALKVYGMSSKEAQIKHYGKVSEYRAAEGKCELIPYKGLAENIIKDILGGLRSSCSYVGARRLKDFDKCCSFIRVNRIK